MWEVRVACFFIFFLSTITSGCGGSSTPAIMISPNPVTFSGITEGAISNATAITVTNPGSAALNIASIKTGGANPGDFGSTTTCSTVLAAGESCTISVTFAPKASGQRSETITLTDNAPNSPQVINVSGAANAIVIALTPTQAALGTGQTAQFKATGDPAGVTWTVTGGGANGAGTIDPNGNFMAPEGGSTTVTVTATSKTDPTKTSSASVNVVAPGTVTATNNVQVALYTISPAAAAKVSVQFGLNTNYGLTTWSQPVSAAGTVSLFVAGMKASTPYHLRGVVLFSDGTTFNDADQTFITGALPSGVLPNITATTSAGMTPQSGVELVDTVSIFGGKQYVFVTDLAGHIIWLFSTPLTTGPNPIKLLSNGHFLINFSAQPDGSQSVIEEVDLGSNVIWQMTAAQLNAALAAAACAGCNVTVTGTHHDFVVLPNGHLIVIAAMQKVLADTTTATGDVLIDLGDMENVGGNNPTHTPQPVWLWNEFDYLDTNRRPYLYPDWTHTNAVLYSSDDGNLIVSIRHQNWLVKMDYSNGTGDGHVIWRLGYQGDFALLDSASGPDNNDTDWFFAQHGPAFTTTNTTGNFSLILFDNGDDRGVTTVVGGTCGVTGQPACYSTVPLLKIDETAMTATLAINPTTPDYSFFGGNAETLSNGNVEYDECAALPLPRSQGKIFEVLQSAPTQPVWQMEISGQDVYRGFRIPSLYPGVQW
jgi:arylsulfate sulfotransferase